MTAEEALAAALLADHPRDAARLLDADDPAHVAALLGGYEPAVAAGTLQRMDPGQAAEVLHRMPEARLAEVLRELSEESTLRVLRHCEPGRREALLAGEPEEAAADLRRALEQAADTAGGLMDPSVPALPADISAREALRLLRRRPQRARHYVYVVDDDRKPVGVVHLRELMLTASRDSLASFMHAPVTRIAAESTTEAILAHPGWRELHALPVVDAAGVLVGVLRRETYERLRDEASLRSAHGTSPAVALAELFWSAAATLVEELATSVRPSGRPNDPKGGTS